jgi:hypothetical protein
MRTQDGLELSFITRSTKAFMKVRTRLTREYKSCENMTLKINCTRERPHSLSRSVLTETAVVAIARINAAGMDVATASVPSSDTWIQERIFQSTSRTRAKKSKDRKQCPSNGSWSIVPSFHTS